MTSERDEAVGRASALQVAVDIATAQKEERKQINDRLAGILRQRSVREHRLQEVADNLQEKINALSSTCTFSPDAGRLLWEIYESRSRVQSPGASGRPAPATDGSAQTAD